MFQQQKQICTNRSKILQPVFGYYEQIDTRSLPGFTKKFDQ